MNAVSGGRSKDEESEFERYRAHARATFKKDRRVNIRISSKDLETLQKRALEEGVPYQTLIASILHKYAGGRLVVKDVIRAADMELRPLPPHNS